MVGESYFEIKTKEDSDIFGASLEDMVFEEPSNLLDYEIVINDPVLGQITATLFPKCEDLLAVHPDLNGWGAYKGGTWVVK